MQQQHKPAFCVGGGGGDAKSGDGGGDGGGGGEHRHHHLHPPKMVENWTENRPQNGPKWPPK